MPVQFSGSLTRASTIQTLMTQWHALFIAAGWELAYANADAIGTGSASSPAWTKTPAATTSAGIVIYRMPAVTGFTTRWCVQIEASWLSGTTIQSFKYTQGTDVSGSALVNPGSAQNTPGAGANNASTNWYLSVYEHGALMVLQANSAGMMWCMDRRRRLDGSIMDDLSVYIGTAAGSTTASIGSTNNLFSGASMSRSVTSGEATPAHWAVFTASDGSVPVTLNRMDGATGIPMGPVNVSGGTAGLPRLFCFLPTNDCTIGVDSIISADGANRAFTILDTAGILNSTTRLPRLAVAKE